jgi:hypothetical protein
VSAARKPVVVPHPAAFDDRDAPLASRAPAPSTGGDARAPQWWCLWEDPRRRPGDFAAAARAAADVALVDSVSVEQLLGAVGPSWSKMTATERKNYGPAEPPPPQARETAALDTWRRELADGLRTPTTLDALWEAASAQQLALDAEQDGRPSLAAEYRMRARQIIAAARRGP